MSLAEELSFVVLIFVRNGSEHVIHNVAHLLNISAALSVQKCVLYSILR